MFNCINLKQEEYICPSEPDTVFCSVTSEHDDCEIPRNSNGPDSFIFGRWCVFNFISYKKNHVFTFFLYTNRGGVSPSPAPLILVQMRRAGKGAPPRPPSSRARWRDGSRPRDTACCILYTIEHRLSGLFSFLSLLVITKVSFNFFDVHHVEITACVRNKLEQCFVKKKSKTREGSVCI